ncbi:MAG: ATP-binding protein [Clostridia bacterium]
MAKKGFFFQRLISAIIILVIMATLITSAIYITITGKLFTEIALAEMEPQALAIGEFYQQYNTEQDFSAFFQKMLSVNAGMQNDYIIIFDATGKIVLNQHQSGKAELVMQASFQVQKDIVLAGRRLVQTSYVMPNEEKLIIVGYPVVGDGGEIAAVFVAKASDNIKATAGDISKALALAAMLTLPIIFVLAILIVNQLIAPLRKIEEVAENIDSGKFTKLADEDEKGEWGRLGRTINYLSQELSKTLNDLMLERNRLKIMLDRLVDGVMAVDTMAEITLVNPAMLKMLSLPESAVTKTIFENQEYLPIKAFFLEALEKQEIQHRSLLLHDSLQLEVTVTLLYDTQKVIGAVALFRDITDMVMLEEMQKNYVANVSHELRTPLTALRGLVEPLRDNMVHNEETKQRYYQIIYDETVRLAKLIDDQLELSRLQSGTISLAKKSFDIANLLNYTVDKYALLANEQSIKLTFESSGKEHKVYSNEDRIEQVLVILLDNAFKFTPAGGSITLWIEKQENWLEVNVTDNGVGINSRDLKHIFERFYKADKARGKIGTGLGLAIAKEILEKLDEKISVRSKEGAGTTFTFTVRFR